MVSFEKGTKKGQGAHTVRKGRILKGEGDGVRTRSSRLTNPMGVEVWVRTPEPRYSRKQGLVDGLIKSANIFISSVLANPSCLGARLSLAAKVELRGHSRPGDILISRLHDFRSDQTFNWPGAHCEKRGLALEPPVDSRQGRPIYVYGTICSKCWLTYIWPYMIRNLEASPSIASCSFIPSPCMQGAASRIRRSSLRLLVPVDGHSFGRSSSSSSRADDMRDGVLFDMPEHMLRSCYPSQRRIDNGLDRPWLFEYVYLSFRRHLDTARRPFGRRFTGVV
ncbi:hypothetical protein F5Y07DRAFT_318955 [Xylaria sp. FL0933]|nr:hypothetical protein F5Y07DRAFT_318955 [Xylaria sp. FL0933]